jgi:hypothetical protein
MCRSVSIVALPSVAQAFVAGDVVLNSFSRKSAVQSAFMTWPNLSVHSVGHFDNRPRKEPQSSQIVTVCSYERNNQIIMTKCPYNKEKAMHQKREIFFSAVLFLSPWRSEVTVEA